jgi:hypothetical protein
VEATDITYSFTASDDLATRHSSRLVGIDLPVDDLEHSSQGSNARFKMIQNLQLLGLIATVSASLEYLGFVPGIKLKNC